MEMYRGLEGSRSTFSTLRSEKNSTHPVPCSLISMVMTVSEHKQSFSSLSGIQNLTHSLQRLVKIGLYYPNGHSLLAKATSNFQRDLLRVARDNMSVRFTVRNERLFLENVELPLTNVFVREFTEILADLGIDELEIDRAIEAGEITSFLQKMLQYHAQARYSHSFQQINFSELPFSVRITQKEFLTTRAPSTPELSPVEAAMQPTLEQFMENLRKKGIDGDQMGRCRAVMEALAIRDMSELQPQPGLPQVDWHDIEQLLIKITGEVKGAAAERGITAPPASLNSLASILHALEKHTSTKRSQEAIRLLVSVVKQKSANTKAGEAEKSPDTTTRRVPPSILSVAELKEFVHRGHPGKDQLNQLLATDRREELGILLLLLETVHPLNVEARIHQSLRDILATPMQESEWEILVKGIQHFLHRVDRTRLAGILRMILPPLRRSESATSITLFNQVLAECNFQEQLEIWPYAVNELIRLGGRTAPADFRQLRDKVASLPLEDLEEYLPFLEELDSFKENVVAPDVCSQLSPRSYRLFGLLLNTPLQPQLLSRIIQDFSVSPPEKLMETVIPFLDWKNPLHVKFLSNYLRQTRPNVPISSDTGRLAGEILAESLLALPRERRPEPFVQEAISAMARLRAEAGGQTLETIIGARRWLFIPEWPAACRKEAAASLRKLRQSAPAGRRWE